MKVRIGDVFGRWTVLDRYYRKEEGWKSKRNFCLVQCGCEDKTIKEIYTANLQNGSSTSCGCFKRENARKLYSHDLTGQTIGRWKVLSKIEADEEHDWHTYYLCQCSCDKKTIREVYGGSLGKGLSQSCGCIRIEQVIETMSGENAPFWKGGISKTKFCLWDTYNEYFSKYHDIRRCQEDLTLLEIKCHRCDKYFLPTPNQLNSRRRVIEGLETGGANLYCSLTCKKSCPTYRVVNTPRNMRNKFRKRERDSILQQEFHDLVLERDNYECQRCGSHDNLEAHHIYGILYSPLESCDIDDATTFCSDCHKLIHKEKGCTYKDLQCKTKQDPNSPE